MKATLNSAASETDLAAAVPRKKRSWRRIRAENYDARHWVWLATPTAGRVGGTGRNLPLIFATSSPLWASQRNCHQAAFTWLCHRQDRHLSQSSCFLQSVTQSSSIPTQAWSIPRLRCSQQHSAPFPPTAITTRTIGTCSRTQCTYSFAALCPTGRLKKWTFIGHICSVTPSSSNISSFCLGP